MTSESLFRAGIAAETIVFIVETILAAILFVLLKPVSQSLSLAAAFSRLGEAIVQAVNLLPSILAFLLVSGGSYLTVFGPEQINALVQLSLNAFEYMILVWGFFFGLHLLLLGYLVYKSGYFPWLFGALLVLSSFGYLIESYGKFMAPQHAELFSTIVLVLGVLGELPFTIYLLWKGINVEKWEERVSEITQKKLLGNLMKAIINTKYGPPEVLKLKDVEKPSPKENEVLIKVHAATVTQGDLMLRKLNPLMYIPMRLFGVRRKRIPGHEFAGVVESVGAGVKSFKTGDQVFGTTTGLSVGANAEYVCLPEEPATAVLAIKPDNISYEEAAALPVGGMTALYILRKRHIRNGQKFLIYGTSGSVGTFAVQLANYHFGADVTGICSTANIELVKSLGADQVIDYTKEDITQNGQLYDVVFDAVGKLSPSQGKKLLKENGTFLTVQTTTREEIENLVTIKELAEAGKIKAVIDKRYPLDQTAEAHKYVETGRKKGNIVINV